MAEILDFKKINNAQIIKRLKQGEIFIFPTDTVYGLGCNALKPASVEELKKVIMKKTPFSVIAPNKEWIYSNLRVQNKNYVKKLPGPFTFIMQKKGRALSRNLNVEGNKLAVRIPNHDFAKLVTRAGIPFVMLNVFSNGKPVRDIGKIPWYIKRKVDVILDDGFLGGHPSSIIDLSEKIAKIIRL